MQSVEHQLNHRHDILPLSPFVLARVRRDLQFRQPIAGLNKRGGDRFGVQIIELNTRAPARPQLPRHPALGRHDANDSLPHRFGKTAGGTKNIALAHIGQQEDLQAPQMVDIIGLRHGAAPISTVCAFDRIEPRRDAVDLLVRALDKNALAGPRAAKTIKHIRQDIASRLRPEMADNADMERLAADRRIGARIDLLDRNGALGKGQLHDIAQQPRQFLLGRVEVPPLRRQELLDPMGGETVERNITGDLGRLQIHPPGIVGIVKNKDHSGPAFGRQLREPECGAMNLDIGAVGHHHHVGRGDIGHRLQERLGEQRAERAKALKPADHRVLAHHIAGAKRK